MQEYIEIISKAKLFKGLNNAEILSTLKCLNASVKLYSKNSVVFHDGANADFIGIILYGEVQTQKLDHNGNANIISKLYSSDFLAVTACYSTAKRIPFDIICVSECRILCLDIGRLIKTCSNACAFHNRLIQNMLNIISDRAIALADKIDILTKRTIREKILAYLYAQSNRAKKQRFTVPLSRRQMAEFLSVNRSALSRELSNLQNEGLLDFYRNSFLLKI